MAPSIAETETKSVPLRTAPTTSLKTEGGFNKENAVSYGRDEEEAKGTAKQPPVSFPNYLPVWDNETERYPPLKPFEHYDHGKDADPSFPDLFPKDGKAVVDVLTPNIGAEVHGVQLSQLSNKGKDQLALYVAQRKVVGMYIVIYH